MSIELKELPSQAAALAAGAAVDVAEVAADPVGAARKRMRDLERKGRPVRRAFGREARRAAGGAVQTAAGVLGGTVPERLLLGGLKLVRARARRRDLVGEAAFRTLSAVHGGLDTAVKSLSRFEAASRPPARAGLNRPTATPLQAAAGRSASDARKAPRATPSPRGRRGSRRPAPATRHGA